MTPITAGALQNTRDPSNNRGTTHNTRSCPGPGSVDALVEVPDEGRLRGPGRPLAVGDALHGAREAVLLIACAAPPSNQRRATSGKGESTQTETRFVPGVSEFERTALRGARGRVPAGARKEDERDVSNASHTIREAQWSWVAAVIGATGPHRATYCMSAQSS